MHRSGITMATPNSQYTYSLSPVSFVSCVNSPIRQTVDLTSIDVSSIDLSDDSHLLPINEPINTVTDSESVIDCSKRHIIQSKRVYRPVASGISVTSQLVKISHTQDSQLFYPKPSWRGKLPSDVSWCEKSGEYFFSNNDFKIPWKLSRMIKGDSLKLSTADIITYLTENVNGVLNDSLEFRTNVNKVDEFMLENNCYFENIIGHRYNENNLDLTTTEFKCSCAEYFFISSFGVNDRTKRCSHIKLNIKDKYLTQGQNECQICANLKEWDGLEQYCSNDKCNQYMCGDCYDQIRELHNSCPYCKREYAL